MTGLPAKATAERPCLQCENTPSELKRFGYVVCGVMSVGEQPELTDEWPRHRWADWTDKELDRAGIKPEAYETHRRTPILTLQWVPCDDTKRGHVPATEEDVRVFADRIGQCIACGRHTITTGDPS